MGVAKNEVHRIQFDSNLKLEFRGARITTDAGLLAVRELDEMLVLTEIAGDLMSRGENGRDLKHKSYGGYLYSDNNWYNWSSGLSAHSRWQDSDRQYNYYVLDYNSARIRPQ